MGERAGLPVGDVVNTARYPLSAPESAGWLNVVRRARDELRVRGCMVLTDFIRPELVDTLRQECAAVAPLAHYDVEVVNAYNIDVNTPLPAGHPGRTTMSRGNAFVARDQIPAHAIISQLYASPFFRHFVATCFGCPEVHELADPLSGLCVNVINPGRSHPWHFDTNEFTVSMLTQGSAAGGVFEYCPNIRSTTNENFDDVRAVLADDGAELIQRLTLRPGDLQLFNGRYSLHRVSTVEGDIARHSAIFAYSERPGVIGTVARTKQLFGRVLPEHLAAVKERPTVDQLLD
jgi:hypothetical protein